MGEPPPISTGWLGVTGVSVLGVVVSVVGSGSVAVGSVAAPSVPSPEGVELSLPGAVELPVLPEAGEIEPSDDASGEPLEGDTDGAATLLDITGVGSVDARLLEGLETEALIAISERRSAKA